MLTKENGGGEIPPSLTQIFEKKCSKCSQTKPATKRHFSFRNDQQNLRSDCKDCQKAQHTKWRIKNKDIVNQLNKKSRLKNRDRLNQKARAKRARIKKEVIDSYGGKCVCCSESKTEFLSLDHVNNNGAEHRKRIEKWGSMYRWAKENNCPPSLQLLCFNCNCAKQFSGYCPHQCTN